MLLIHQRLQLGRAERAHRVHLAGRDGAAEREAGDAVEAVEEAALGNPAAGQYVGHAAAIAQPGAGGHGTVDTQLAGVLQAT
ncbi:unannotated protein [freshwater metagenome]|uniref:Unannotated protein n=1 Tax=freshwater metagenome TaxID=449393 RepID=A0A6J7P5M5_9ZZZZ